MALQVPVYVAERIRRPPPAGCCVVGGSTPIVAFDDVRSATVATLGLNPSKAEFLDPHGRELTGRHRRLATLRSLGADDLTDASDAVVAEVYAACVGYFQRNPYRRWFDQLKGVLAAVGASYYDGSACHLDLVQWATDPVWGQLRPAHLRQGLLTDGSSFLRQQLKHEQIRLLLLNGQGVVSSFEELTGEPLDEVARIPTLRSPTRLLTGTTGSGTLVVGWSTNLQSSFGVTDELRNLIAQHVAALARGGV